MTDQSFTAETAGSKRRPLVLIANNRPDESQFWWADEFDASLELATAESVLGAYWKFQKECQRTALIVLDVLWGERGTEFGGVELAIAMDSIARQKRVKLPLVLYTNDTGEGVQRFLRQKLSSLVLVRVYDAKVTPAETVKGMKVLIRQVIDKRPERLEPDQTVKLGKSGQPTISAGEDNDWRDRLHSRSTLFREGPDLFKKICASVAERVLGSYSAVSVDALAPGFSGFDVLSFSAVPEDLGTNRKTMVVKVARLDEDKAKGLYIEATAYVSHCEAISDYVPLLIGPIQVEVDGQEFGALVYEFVGQLQEPHPLSATVAYLLDKKEPRSDVRRRAFAAVVTDVPDILSAWNRKPPGSMVPAELLRSSFPMDKLYKRAKEVYPELDEQLKKNPRAIFMDGIPGLWRNPVDLLQAITSHNKSYSRAYEFAVRSGGRIHGDLHCDNILRVGRVGLRQEYKLIDFAHVNPNGHRQQDLARLECDIKIRHSGDLTEEEFLRLELELAKDLGYTPERVFQRSDDERADFADSRGEIQEDIRIHPMFKLIDRLREQSIRWPEDMDGAKLSLLVALVVQSLWFFNNVKSGKQTRHAWLSACVNADFLEQALHPDKKRVD